MKNIILVLVLSTSVFVDAKKQEHRHHKAHKHGAAKMSIAFDGLKGRIEFTSPAESILGFEHEAKSDKHKAIMQNMVKTLAVDFSKIVQFEANLGCVFSIDAIAQKLDSKNSKHSDFIANFNIECTKPVAGTKVNFNFSQFEKLKDIDVTILADKFQKNIEISNKESSTELK